MDQNQKSPKEKTSCNNSGWDGVALDFNRKLTRGPYRHNWRNRNNNASVYDRFRPTRPWINRPYMHYGGEGWMNCRPHMAYYPHPQPMPRGPGPRFVPEMSSIQLSTTYPLAPFGNQRHGHPPLQNPIRQNYFFGDGFDGTVPMQSHPTGGPYTFQPFFPPEGASDGEVSPLSPPLPCRRFPPVRMIASEDDEEYHPEPVRRSSSSMHSDSEDCNSRNSFEELSSEKCDAARFVQEYFKKSSRNVEIRPKSTTIESPQKKPQELDYQPFSIQASDCKDAAAVAVTPDEQKPEFSEVFIAASTKTVFVSPGCAELKASFGVWFGADNELNFSARLANNKPQCLKAALITASTQAIETAKGEGLNKIKISMESDFLVSNVCTWINKFMKDACDGHELTNHSNWDEYKYTLEIKHLCQSFQGMIIKWSHVTGQQEGILKAKSLARSCLVPTA